jgi:hypothetical protein
MSKRASYREAIECIAHNDEPEERDAAEMVGYASVLVIAYIFDKEQDVVANDVVRYRERHNI